MSTPAESRRSRMSLACSPQRRLGERAGDDDIAYALVEVEAVDHRPLGVLRQRLDPIHGVLDVGQRRVEICPGLELHDDRADTLHGLREDALDPVEEADLRLDCRDDVGIHILGAGAGPGHADRDPFDGEGGEELSVHARKPERAEQDHQHHDEVGGRTVAREQRDQTATGLAHRTSTLTPGPISGKRVVATLSPSADSAGYHDVVADAREQRHRPGLEPAVHNGVDCIAADQRRLR